MALLIPVIFLISYFLQSTWNKSSILIKIVPVLLVLLVTLEQVQLVEHSNISRAERAAVVNLADPVPVDADAFYAVGKPVWGWHKDSPHNSAMLLSQVWNLPTINGRSGFLAKDWPMYEMNPDIAFSNLHKWANEKSLTGSIYMYDLDSGKWIRNLNFSSSENGFSVNDDLMSLPLDEFRKIANGGWSNQEFGGVWSDGNVAKLQFPEMDFISEEANLVLNLSAHLHELHPKLSVQIIINGTVVIQEEFSIEHPRKTMTIPISIDGRKGWSLEFHIDSPVSPKSLGLHDDSRLLGIALYSLQIQK